MNTILLDFNDAIGSALGFGILTLIVGFIQLIRKQLFYKEYLRNLNEIKFLLEKGDKISTHEKFTHIKDISSFHDLDYLNLEIKKHQKNIKSINLLLFCLILIPILSYLTFEFNTNNKKDIGWVNYYYWYNEDGTKKQRQFYVDGKVV